MNKRGQALPLNTLIIIILVVIVLIVVAVFFLGGTSKLSQSIRTIFYGTTAGTDVVLAREICEQRCESAKGGTTLAYCKLVQDIDRDGNGELEEGLTGNNKEIGVTCLQLMGNSHCSRPGTSDNVCGDDD